MAAAPDLLDGVKVPGAGEDSIGSREVDPVLSRVGLPGKQDAVTLGEGHPVNLRSGSNEVDVGEGGHAGRLLGLEGVTQGIDVGLVDSVTGVGDRTVEPNLPVEGGAVVFESGFVASEHVKLTIKPGL